MIIKVPSHLFFMYWIWKNLSNGSKYPSALSKGYRNFVFVTNLKNTIEKTKENF